MIDDSCILLLIVALQLFMQSSGLNQFLPSSILDKGLPIWHFWLLCISSSIFLPTYLWSSCWPSSNVFPAVYCLDHPCFLHPLNVTKPSQPLCSNEVYYVLVFYYFIQFLVGFYSPNTIFVYFHRWFLYYRPYIGKSVGAWNISGSTGSDLIFPVDHLYIINCLMRGRKM